MTREWLRVLRDVFATDLSKKRLEDHDAEIVIRVNYDKGLDCCYTPEEYLRLRQVKRYPTRQRNKRQGEDIYNESEEK